VRGPSLGQARLGLALAWPYGQPTNQPTILPTKRSIRLKTAPLPIASPVALLKDKVKLALELTKPLLFAVRPCFSVGEAKPCFLATGKRAIGQQGTRASRQQGNLGAYGEIVCFIKKI